MGTKRRTKSNINSLSPSKLKSYLLNYFKKNPKKRLSAGQLAKKLKYYNNNDSIRYALEALSNENVLLTLNDGRFVLNKNHEDRSSAKSSHSRKIYSGTVDSIKSGAAYIIMADLDKDVYVPYRNLNGAVHGDDVELSVTFNRGKNPEGKIHKIVKRNTKQIMGVFNELKKFATVRSSKVKLDLEVFVKKEHYNSASNGDRVLIEITEWGEGEKVAWGKVTKLFNSVDDHNWTMESILVENGFSSDYPKDVMQEVAKIPLEISEEDLGYRRDFRDILTFTIDPDTAQDFDDAISYNLLDDGNLEIGVHIADVTHYLRPNTALDKEAFNRSTSVYLVDRCIAMLPEKLSNNLCSLMPKVDRLTFSAVFTFNKNKIVKEWFGKGVIYSDKRFTYEEAQQSLEDKKGLYHSELTAINQLAYALRSEKFANGAIAFESDELKFILDEKNKPIGVFVKERKDAHLLVEDFMLLANRQVAHYIATKNKEREIPFVYRIHDTPDVDRLSDLSLFMKEFGLKLDLSSPDKVAESFNKLSEKSRKEPVYKLLMQFAIRTMAKAIYSTNNIGHYGLSFEHYTHFTSPIRRYSDVLVHRVLEQNLEKDSFTDKVKLEAKCMHISKQERKAMEAERDSIKYKQVEFMSNHVGKVFDGIISGMIERGLFVEMTETKSEGFIPFNNFYESFQMKPGRFKAVGLKSGKAIKLGDPISVLVLSVDLENRQIELEPVNL